MVEVRMPLISIVIVNYNGKKFLKDCLTSVLNTRYPNFEVIIVDNGSRDGSVDFIKREFGRNKRLKIIPLDKNYGLTYAINVGVSKSKGEYIACLDNDVKVTPRWLNGLIFFMFSNPDVAVVQPKLLFLNKRNIIDGTGDFPTIYGFPLRPRGQLEPDKGQYDEKHDIFSARGAAFLIRKKVFYEVGEMDSDFFFHLNDIDLGWRVRLRGYRIAYVPTSIVYHNVHGTLKDIDPYDSTFHHYKNVIVMLIKNYETKNLLKYVGVPLIILTGGLIKDVLTKKRRIPIARCKAIMWIIKNFRKIWLKRLNVQLNVRRICDDQIKKHMIKKMRFSFFNSGKGRK